MSSAETIQAAPTGRMTGAEIARELFDLAERCQVSHVAFAATLRSHAHRRTDEHIHARIRDGLMLQEVA